MQTLVLIGGNEKTLSKNQKSFNNYVRKITKLQKELDTFIEWQNVANQGYQVKISPLKEKLLNIQLDFVLFLDKSHDSGILKKTELKKLADIIMSHTFSLIKEWGKDELKPMYQKYSNEDFDQAIAQSMKTIFETITGIKLDDDIDISSPQKFQEEITRKMAEHQANMQDKALERTSNRLKTPKQAVADAKRLVEEKNISNAVRKIYMDLAKIYHPDREPDENKRAKKTEIMQEITAAYNRNDLFALLKLQLQLQKIDQDHLDTIANNQLTYFNKVLKTQAKELEEKLWQMQEQVSNIPAHYIGPQIDIWLNHQTKQLKKEIKDLEKELKILSIPENLRQMLKNYRIQKKSNFDPFW